MSSTQTRDNLQQYIIVTGCYWAFTLTDGALRMLVVLYFHDLGYSPIEIASLFILYEFFGVITNLAGGWLATYKGLNLTLRLGLGLQIFALCMLLAPSELMTIAYVMIAQAASGIAKDLNKMSAKSSLKNLTPDDPQGKLYKWVTLLTGSKNALKGIGFFLGAALLASLGFQTTITLMIAMLSLALLISNRRLKKEEKKSKFKAKFTTLLSKSRRINLLSAARLFLFGARDIWFAIALPVYLQSKLNWQHVEVGTFLAVWIIAYGAVQSLAPRITKLFSQKPPNGRTAFYWSLPLILISVFLGFYEQLGTILQTLNTPYTPEITSSLIVSTLLIFGFFFAINSSIHSYLIIAYADQDGVSLDVGFYYMANATGRLVGTILSGYLYQTFGFSSCLIGTSAFLTLTAAISLYLPKHH